jgi:hypothetical protein
MNIRLGQAHRIRLMNIAPAGDIVLKMMLDSTAVAVKCLAKDGTDLPALQQAMVKQSQLFGVGETGDFEFKPLKPGTYTLWVMYNEELSWKQKWVVTR